MSLKYVNLAELRLDEAAITRGHRRKADYMAHSWDADQLQALSVAAIGTELWVVDGKVRVLAARIAYAGQEAELLADVRIAASLSEAKQLFEPGRPAVRVRSATPPNGLAEGFMMLRMTETERRLLERIRAHPNLDQGGVAIAAAVGREEADVRRSLLLLQRAGLIAASRGGPGHTTLRYQPKKEAKS